jgi:drug/metabolite transporter (DMT)-like permease
LLFSGTRFILAGLLVLLFARARRYPFPVHAGEYLKLAVVGLFLMVGGTGLVSIVSRWVHSGMSALIIATIPLFMALLEMLACRRSTLGFKGWAGLLTGFGGVVFLVLANEGTGSVDLLGASLLLLASLSWSLGSLYAKSFHPSGSSISHVGLHMLSGGVVLFLAGLVVGEAPGMHLSVKSLGAILYLVVFGSIIAYSSYIYVLDKWPASKAGTYAYVNPVVALFLGALILKETISFSVVLSSFIILGSVYAVQTSKAPGGSLKAREGAAAGAESLPSVKQQA